MSVTINGTTGVTTPAVASDSYTGPINVSSSAPDNSVTLAASGRLGIGTTSPANQLDVKNAGGGTAITCRTGTTAGGNWIDYYNASNSRQGIVGFLDSTNLYIYNDASAAITFSTAGTERARIDSSGNLLVGTTSNLGSGARLNVNYSFSNDGAAWKSDSTNTHNAIIFINPNGTVGTIRTNASTTSYNTSSDYRLKENIHPMTGALAKVAALKPCTYKWKVDGSDGEGFIAHELAEVVPQCVTGEKDAVDAEGKPVYQGIDTSFLVGVLTAAIQELKAELDTVKAELATLKGAQA